MKQAEIRTFHVAADSANRTLAAMLRAVMADTAWSRIEGLIRTRRVTVNGNLCLDAARRLKALDVVKVLPHPTAPLPRAEDVRVRFLDKHLVVVEKPAGMTSVRHAEERTWSNRRRDQQPTLEDLLPRILAKREAGRGGASGRAPNQKRTRTPPVRPVHRLDRDTSGLMVFARTVPAERDLGNQFRAHSTHRRYLAIVMGHVEAMRVETRLIRDRGDGRRGGTNDPNLGKRAVTHVRPLEHAGEYTLVECRLETGRTHQIRIHLSERGHMLLGEKVYDKPLGGKPVRDPSHAPRLALHAAELGLIHPITRERLTFEMPLPRDLADFWERLKREAK